MSPHAQRSTLRRMDIQLHDWAPSPFCMKVRAILDYKGLPYVRRPALRTVAELKRRGGIGKVPALEIDGRLVTDSTDIAYELERIAPRPPIVPAQPRERALCHALEDWCDEALYFMGLHFQWVDPPGARMVPRAFGGSLAGRIAYRWYDRRIRRQLWGQGTGRKAPERIAQDLRRELDAIDALLDPGPFLLGEAPMLCDFALMAQLVYLSRPPGSAQAMQGRAPIAAFLGRMQALRSTREPARGPQPVPAAMAAQPS